MEAIVFSLLGAVGVAYYTRMAARLPERTTPKVDFDRVDAMLASVLALWIIAQIVDGFGKHLQITTQGINLTILIYFFIVVIIMGALVGRDRNPALLFGLKWQKWQQGIFFALGSLLAAYPLILLPVVMMNALGVKPEPQDIVLYLESAKSLQDRLPMIVMAVIVAPVAEELIFRGYLHGVLRKYSGRWFSIGATSLLFAAIHGHLPALAPLFIFALALALVYERTGSLWAPMLMHSAFNTVTVVAALTWPEILQ